MRWSSKCINIRKARNDSAIRTLEIKVNTHRASRDTHVCVCVCAKGHWIFERSSKEQTQSRIECASLLKRSFECERGHVNEKANEVFYEKEQIIDVSFKDIEDRSLELRLQALQTEYGAINEQCF